MTLPPPTISVPLRDDGRGGIQVGECVFPLDLLIHEYEQGADPEGIVHAYPVLKLEDVYAVIAYYLRHKDEVSAYLKRREEEGAELRRQIEIQQAGQGSLRERLLARRAQQETESPQGGESDTARAWCWRIASAVPKKPAA
ncbi:MAG: DUF433 domain-containing protein [Gemmataceae bacterium]|nr:DUF433 domain-containing protein [Gemmataceae bacterium]